MKRTLMALALLAACAGFPVAQAQGYLGASAGQSELKEDCDPGLTCDFKDTGFKAFGGYMFTPNLGIEGAYVDLGKAKVSAPGASAELKSSGFGVWGVAVLPIDRFSIFGKAGFAYLDTKLTGSVSGFGSGSESESNANPAFGVGAAFDITKEVAVRVEYERFRVEFQGEKSNVDLFSAGVVFRF